jgi:two-component system sensor histidine kinase KdpD
MGLADTLAMTPPAAPVAETAAALREGARAMVSLVENLLEMARLQSGQVVLRREWQSLEEVIGSAVRLSAMPLAGHPLKLELAPSLPLVAFDAVMIERVLCNLLENAAKYSPAGSTITLAATLQQKMLTVRVSDQGPGFPPDDPNGMFDLFARRRSEDAVPGVGLGLAICRAIIEAHGGRIWAENIAGGGQVSLELPAGDPPAVEGETP